MLPEVNSTDDVGSHKSHKTGAVNSLKILSKTERKYMLFKSLYLWRLLLNNKGASNKAS